MISVCIATYNGADFIEEQLQSIVSELETDDEIVISDDNSTDCTLSIIESFNDSRINIFKNEGKPGINSNMENAMRRAKGEIILLADQDNLWIKGKVRKCREALKDCNLILHDCIITDEKLTPLPGSLFEELDASTSFIKNIWRNCFTGCCMGFKRELLDIVLPIPETRLFYYDQWIGLVLTMKGKIKLLKEPLLYLRRHNNTLSTVAQKSSLNLLEKLSYRFLLLRYLLKTKLRNR